MAQGYGLERLRLCINATGRFVGSTTTGTPPSEGLDTLGLVVILDAEAFNVKARGVAATDDATLGSSVMSRCVGRAMLSLEARRRATRRAAFSFSDRNIRVASSR